MASLHGRRAKAEGLEMHNQVEDVFMAQLQDPFLV
jgi:hypothetical protein